MSISKLSTVSALANRLTKPEKRHFMIFAERQEQKESYAHYLKMYKILIRYPEISDRELMKKLDISSAQNLSNYKRHLFEQILISLDILYAKKQENIKTLKFKSFALILKDKALYEASNYYVRKATYNSGLSPSPEENRIMSLTEQERLLKQIEELSKEAYFIGFSTSEKEQYLRQKNIDTFRLSINTAKNNSPLFNILNGLQCYLQQDFRKSYYHLIKALSNNLFNKSTDLKTQAICLDTILDICYLYKNKRCFHKYQGYLTKLVEQQPSTPHTSIIYCQYVLKHQIRHSLLISSHTKLDQIESKWTAYSYRYKETFTAAMHCQFSYLLAYAKFCCSDYEKSIDIQNEIIEKHPEFIHSQQGSFLRLLQLTCHYRLNNFQFVDYNLNNLRNHFISTTMYTKHNEWMVQFFRRGVKALNFGLKDDINDIMKRMSKPKKLELERFSYIFFDYKIILASIRDDTSVFGLSHRKELES